MSPRLGCALPLFLLACAAGAGPPPEVSFRNDVMAVLSKAGCNQGVCHGNRSGRGGFKLSLRGEDPDLDFLTLTRDLFGRRINRSEPEQSLVLLKPAAAVPHEGGRRFARGSPEHRVLLDWIRGGLRPDSPEVPRPERLLVAPEEKVLVGPEEEVQIEARALFADGAARDVTALAVYESSQPVAEVDPTGRVRLKGTGEATVLVRFLGLQAPVRLARIPARPELPPETTAASYVDRHVLAKLRTLRIRPSGPCTDAVFLRRAHLDLLGLLPTAEEARAFAADPRPDKRSLLIDRLLSRPEFADSWALKWSDLLHNEEKSLDRKGVQAFHRWIREAIASGKPLDQFARELIAARGSSYSSPASNFYRSQREPLGRAESAAQVFLGLRLQCARCHNHPFDRWTQDDYYGWAALFTRVRYKVLENRRRDKNDLHEFVGEQVVWMAREGELENPRTGKPAAPRFLGGPAPEWGPERDRLRELADWVASPENPFFARAQANRIWYHLMGRGLVDPIDDFRPTNPPSNGPLLEALAADLAAHRFDLRHLIRVIMSSRAYQLSAEPNETNREDEANFSRAAVRRLSAEELLDAESQVTGAPLRFSGYPPGVRAGQLPGVEAVRGRDAPPSGGDQFLALFGKPPRLLSCECERSSDTTVGQAFQLVSGPLLNDLLTRPGNRLSRLLESGKPAGEVIEELYWTALGRPPRRAEEEAARTYLAGSAEPRAALEDLTWGLLNSKEFLLRQ